MSTPGKILASICKVRHFSSTKRNFMGGKIIFSKATTPSSKAAIPSVQGLSEKVVKVPNDPVGPGATKTSNYPNPEYFCYDKNSYFEAEVEMLKYRCPQPSVSQYYEHSNPK